MARRGHGSDDERNGASTTTSIDTLPNAEEEAIRAKLRESGWEKKRHASNDDASSAPRKPSDGSDNGDASDRPRAKDERTRERERDSRRRGSESRRSRSAPRRDRERGDDRRDRDRDSTRRSRRDRSAKRSSKPRSSRRSRSHSKSRSASRSRRVGSSHHRRRGASRSRSVSTGRERKSQHAAPSKSRSASPTKASNAKSADDADMGDAAPQDASADDAMDIDEAPAAEVSQPTDKPADSSSSGAKDKERTRGRASRHSRSPSRSSRRRRHRASRSRSLSLSRSARHRRVGGSRSASRSRGQRNGVSSSRRRRRSRSRSASRDHRRRRRSSSRDRKRRESLSSPDRSAAAQSQPPLPSAEAPPLPTTSMPPPLVAMAPPGVNPSITQLMQQHPTLSLQEIIAKMQASTVTLAAAAAQKPARELYIGNLPAHVTGPQLHDFLNAILLQVGLVTQPGSPILTTWLSADGHFAFCEMRSLDECTLALLLNGLTLLGQPLKLGRPRSYTGPPVAYPPISAQAQAALAALGCAPSPMWFTGLPNIVGSVGSVGAAVGTSGYGGMPPPAMPMAMGAPPLPPSMPRPSGMPPPPLPPLVAGPAVALPTPMPATLLSTLTADGSTKRLLLSNVPVVLTESQVRELVEPLGTLASVTLVTDSTTGLSTGNAVVEYELEQAANEALEALNGIDIGGIPLVAKRATSVADDASDVLQMTNMVAIDELEDDSEFADLKEDVDDECKRFGHVVDLVIPRPQDGESVPGVGNIYVRFSQQSEAAAALKALSGRKFGGNTVHVTYYPVAKFERKEFA